jgi:hypothetical protein
MSDILPPDISGVTKWNISHSGGGGGGGGVKEMTCIWPVLHALFCKCHLEKDDIFSFLLRTNKISIDIDYLYASISIVYILLFSITV